MLIAGVPVALPIVMSIITSIGVVDLSKKNIIVRRMSSLEDLSNVNLLLTDKTGTMTNNKIVVENVVAYKNYQKYDVIRYAAISAFQEKNKTQSIRQLLTD